MRLVSMADARYFRTVLLSVRQSARFYPDRRFLLYDWGFETPQIDRLRDLPGIEIRPWRDRLIDPSRLFPPRSPFRAFVRRHLLRDPDLRIPLDQWRKELLLDEKCYCLLDAAVRIDGPFLFLDADAFIVNRVDELCAPSADVVVTLRPRGEIDAARRRGSVGDLNSGVIAFNGGREKSFAFITEWIKEMHLLNLRRHLLSEQTALARLILRSDPGAFRRPEGQVDLSIGGLAIRCRIVPTARFNYNAVENGFDPEQNRILHLKGGRGFSTAVDEVEAALAQLEAGGVRG
jgi:hypothetical protein